MGALTHHHQHCHHHCHRTYHTLYFPTRKPVKKLDPTIHLGVQKMVHLEMHGWLEAYGEARGGKASQSRCGKMQR